MIPVIIIESVILIFTILIKRKGFAVVGFIVDLYLDYCELSAMFELFSKPETAGEAIGHMIVLPITLVLLFAVIGLTIAQTCQISKYGRKK